MSNKLRRLAEDKLIILYLVEKMGIALSNSEICQFLLEKNYINYFNAQQYLSELVESGFLDQQKENNTTRYSLTDEGTEVLSIFIKHISPAAKNDIITYVHDNGKKIKQNTKLQLIIFLNLIMNIVSNAVYMIVKVLVLWKSAFLFRQKNKPD